MAGGYTLVGYRLVHNMEKEECARKLGWEMFPLSTRQFSSTFLDFGRNRRGYEGEVTDEDRDAMKALLSPFLSNSNDDFISRTCKCNPQSRHYFANVLWDFAKRCSTVHSQQRRRSLESVCPPFRRKVQGNDNCIGNIGVPVYDDNDDDVVGGFANKITEDLQFSSQRADPSRNSLPSGGSVPVDNLICYGQNTVVSEECTPVEVLCKKDAKMANDHTYFSVSSICDKKYPDELECEDPCIKPLPWYKQVKHCNRTISPSLTLNINLAVLESVLHSKEKASRNSEFYDAAVCGRIAILQGLLEEETPCITVVRSEEVGVYDYTEGTVQPISQRRYPESDLDIKEVSDPLLSSSDFTVNLSEFLEQCYSVPNASSLEKITNHGRMDMEHSPVAWLLTSPALGVSLDWQVHKQVLNYLKKQSLKFKVSETDHCSSEWCNILVVLDEYRYAETDIPQLEIYQLFVNGTVNLVNFDIN